MVFCGNCGTPVENGKCPKCGRTFSTTAVLSSAVSKAGQKRAGMKKVYVCGIIAIAAMIILALVPHTVNEPCDWCGNSPSMEFKISDGSTAFVCRDCSKVCAWCGNKATEHYENALGMMVFVCDNCYREIKNN